MIGFEDEFESESENSFSSDSLDEDREQLQRKQRKKPREKRKHDRIDQVDSLKGGEKMGLEVSEKNILISTHNINGLNETKPDVSLAILEAESNNIPSKQIIENQNIEEESSIMSKLESDCEDFIGAKIHSNLANFGKPQPSEIVMDNFHRSQIQKNEEDEDFPTYIPEKEIIHHPSLGCKEPKKIPEVSRFAENITGKPALPSSLSPPEVIKPVFSKKNSKSKNTTTNKKSSKKINSKSISTQNLPSKKSHSKKVAIKPNLTQSDSTNLIETNKISLKLNLLQEMPLDSNTAVDFAPISISNIVVSPKSPEKSSHISHPEALSSNPFVSSLGTKESLNTFNSASRVKNQHNKTEKSRHTQKISTKRPAPIGPIPSKKTKHKELKDRQEKIISETNKIPDKKMTECTKGINQYTDTCIMKENSISVKTPIICQEAMQKEENSCKNETTEVLSLKELHRLSDITKKFRKQNEKDKKFLSYLSNITFRLDCVTHPEPTEKLKVIIYTARYIEKTSADSSLLTHLKSKVTSILLKLLRCVPPLDSVIAATTISSRSSLLLKLFRRTANLIKIDLMEKNSFKRWEFILQKFQDPNMLSQISKKIQKEIKKSKYEREMRQSSKTLQADLKELSFPEPLHSIFENWLICLPTQNIFTSISSTFPIFIQHSEKLIQSLVIKIL